LPLSRQNGALRYVFTLCALVVGPALASTPSSGTLTDTNPTVSYTAGPFLIPNVTDNVNGTPLCDPIIPAEQCDTFLLTVNVASGDATTKRIRGYHQLPDLSGRVRCLHLRCQR